MLLAQLCRLPLLHHKLTYLLFPLMEYLLKYLALLILKGLNIQKQRRAMLIEALPSDISGEINIHNLMIALINVRYRLKNSLSGMLVRPESIAER